MNLYIFICIPPYFQLPNHLSTWNIQVLVWIIYDMTLFSTKRNSFTKWKKQTFLNCVFFKNLLENARKILSRRGKSQTQTKQYPNSLNVFFVHLFISLYVWYSMAFRTFHCSLMLPIAVTCNTQHKVAFRSLLNVSNFC